MPVYEQYGTDTSGRKILMTPYMHDWFEDIVRELGFRPTIVQGAWMKYAGGGAADSAGYHDGGGCLDLRVWDRTSTQVESMIHAFRWGGAGAWLRNPEHGGFSDPHVHLVLGSDQGLASGAAWQWLNYIHGGDGLASGGKDYHPRPNPLVTEPPKSLMEEAMQPEDFDKIRAITEKVIADQTPAIAKAAAKAVLDSDVISKLDVSVREALRAAFNDSNRQSKK